MDPPGCGLRHALYFTNKSIRVLRNQVIFLIRSYIQCITNYKLEPISWLPSSVCSIKMHTAFLFSTFGICLQCKLQIILMHYQNMA